MYKSLKNYFYYAITISYCYFRPKPRARRYSPHVSGSSICAKTTYTTR